MDLLHSVESLAGDVRRFSAAMASGQLEVIAPAAQYYPSLVDLRDTFGDTIERVRSAWKQLDLSELVNVCERECLILCNQICHLNFIVFF